MKSFRENGLKKQIVHRKKRARIRDSDSDSEGISVADTSYKNRFSVLRDMRDPTIHDRDVNKHADQANENNGEPKPPPIFIPGVKSITEFSALLQAEVQNGDYTHKTIDNSGQIKIMAKNVETYRKITRQLDTAGASYHTYQLKQQRAYRAVIRSLHPSTPPEEIKGAIEQRGHQVRNVTNIRHGKTKEPLPLFFVDLEPNTNNKDIFKLDLLLNAKVQIEPPRKNKTIVQCIRCQMYGHTKTYCRRPFRCVKCGDNHSTFSCTKNREIPAKCALCDGDHPANYKGCRIYQDILQNRDSSTQKPHWYRPQMTHENTLEERQIHRTLSHNPLTSGNTQSYAQATSSNREQDFNNNTDISAVIEKSFTEFKAVLMQQNELLNTLLKLLTTVLTKFSEK